VSSNWIVPPSSYFFLLAAHPSLWLSSQRSARPLQSRANGFWPTPKGAQILMFE